SSRRRHTRSKRDWSSDVCSSDLDPSPAAERYGIRLRADTIGAQSAGLVGPLAQVHLPGEPAAQFRQALTGHVVVRNLRRVKNERSEERRVGKEGRSRWMREELKA